MIGMLLNRRQSFIVFVEDQCLQGEISEAVVSMRPHRDDEGGKKSHTNSKQEPMVMHAEARHVVATLQCCCVEWGFSRTLHTALDA